MSYFSPKKSISQRYSTSSTITTTNSNNVSYSITPPKHNYYIFENKVESNSFDTILAMVIASINLLGIEYYVELKRQGVVIHDEKVKDFLEYQLTSYERNKKIEEIVE